MAGNVAPNTVTDGLVLYLDAANVKSYASGSTSWNDLVGTNNGTLVNGPTFSRANGGSIVFDGTNDTTNFGNILNIGLNSLTISCWVKFTTSAGIFGIMGKTSLRSYVGRYAFYVDSTNIGALFQPSGNYLITTSIFPYLDNKFQNLKF